MQRRYVLVALASFALAGAIASPAHGYQNGALPQSELSPIYYPGAKVYLRNDAAAAWNAMREYCRARGVDLYPKGPNSAYRTVAQQKLMKKIYGANAATPGTSNHGLGIAVDVATQEMRKAIDRYGAQFGWAKKWSDASWEWWHLKYKPGVWSGSNPGVVQPGGDDDGLPTPNLPSTGPGTNAGNGSEDNPVTGAPTQPGDGTTGGDPTTTGPSDSSGFATLVGDIDSRNMVKRGSQGSDVRDLQRVLQARGYEIDDDGIFGPKTERAVRDFQKKNKLGADGVVGSKTWKALAKP